VKLYMIANYTTPIHCFVNYLIFKNSSIHVCILKLDKFLHSRLSEIESEETFDTFASVHCSCHSQTWGRGVWDFREGKFPSLPKSPRINTELLDAILAESVQQL